jgi:hypothetical protein
MFNFKLSTSLVENLHFHIKISISPNADTGTVIQDLGILEEKGFVTGWRIVRGKPELKDPGSFESLPSF